MPRRCAIDRCENDISDRSKLDICPTCRSGLYYWRKRRPAEILERRRKLTMYDARLATMVDERDRVLPQNQRAQAIRSFTAPSKPGRNGQAIL